MFNMLILKFSDTLKKKTFAEIRRQFILLNTPSSFHLQF